MFLFELLCPCRGSRHYRLPHLRDTALFRIIALFIVPNQSTDISIYANYEFLDPFLYPPLIHPFVRSPSPSFTPFASFFRPTDNHTWITLGVISRPRFQHFCKNRKSVNCWINVLLSNSSTVNFACYGNFSFRCEESNDNCMSDMQYTVKNLNVSITFYFHNQNWYNSINTFI